MKKLDLEAQERKETGKKTRGLRKSGFIPAVVYGHGFDPVTVSVAEKKILSLVGTVAHFNAIINLKIGETDYSVLAHDLQRDAVTDKILHIDFLRVKMDEAIKAKVHVELLGIPVGVKDDGGILVHVLREIEIKCLPANIPDKIELDVSQLNIGDGLLVSDIKGLADIEFLTPQSEHVVKVSAPTKEEEVAPIAPVEGEAAAAGAPAAPQEGVASAPAGPATKAQAPAKQEPKKQEAKK